MLGKAVGYATRGDMVLPMQRLNHRDSGKPTASGDPAAEPEQLEQVVAGADEQPFPVDLRQAPQQELPETRTCLIWPNTGSTVSIRRA